MARTGCAFAAVTCLCCPARTHRDRQVLPAYGLQDLPIKTQNPSRGSKPNTMWLPITLGESLGRGHFYLAETRTFLLCVDTNLQPERAASILSPTQKLCQCLAANYSLSLHSGSRRAARFESSPRFGAFAVLCVSSRRCPRKQTSLPGPR